MKKNIVYFGFLSLVIILTGCPGAIDSIAWKDLGHGYIYHDQVGLPTISNNINGKGINGVVFRYDFNNEFIVALEKDVKLSQEDKDKLIESGDVYDYLLHNGYSKYWIIAHSNDSIYGPFNKQEYLQKKIELRVPDNLKLKTE